MRHHFNEAMVAAAVYQAAANYPTEIVGAWDGRVGDTGNDDAKAAVAACSSYKKNPKEVIGDLPIFRGSQISSLGGYED